MGQTVPVLEDVNQRPSMYLYIVQAQVKAEDLSGAMDSIRSAFSALEVITDEADEFHIYRDGALASIAQAQAETGEIEAARETVARLVLPAIARRRWQISRPYSQTPETRKPLSFSWQTRRR